MPSAADTAIQSLRAVHDELAARVRGYAEADLGRPSGAAEWTVAQVLSHIGSGAEIALAGLEAARAGSPPPEQSFYQSVWDRWNAMSPRQQANGCVSSDAALVEGYEALDGATRNSLRLELPFLPEPVDLDLQAALRLNESTLHGWDVAAADDPAATLNPTAVPLLVDALTGPMSFLVGAIGKSGGADGVLAVRAFDPDRQLTLRISDPVALEASAPDAADGTLTLPAEALLRLLTGRLGGAEHTPATVTVTGPLDLVALRAVFPGF